MSRRPTGFFKKRRSESKSSEPVIASAPDQTLEIYEGDQRLSLSLSTFREKVVQLHKVWRVKIYDLSAEDRRLLNEVTSVVGKFYSDPEKYSLLIKEIQSVFGGIQEPESETVAARLVGCFSSNNPLKNRACDPKCAFSIKPGFDTGEWTACDSTVLSLEGTQIHVLHDSGSSEAYISIGKNSVFTEQNIKQLKDRKIEKITVLYHHDDEKTEVKGPYLVENLRSIDSKPNNDSNQSFSGWAIAFIIVLIFFVLLLGWLMYYTQMFN